MTRTYAAKRLLEHGPLTFHEFMEITGWSYESCHKCLQLLLASRVAFYHLDVGCRKNIYRLAA